LEIFLLIFSSNILHLNPDNHRICKKKPVACQENATFVIDASLLPNFDDYKYDDLGIKKRIRQIKRDTEPSGNTSTTCSLSQVVDVYKEIVEECRRNVHHAVIDLCPYKLADAVSHIHVPAEQWIGMTDKEKAIKPIDPLYKAKDLQPTLHCQKESLGPFEESGLPQMFQENWKKANIVLEKDGVSVAPGTEKTKVVMSLSNPNSPHLVTGRDRWKILKCDCDRFKKKSICHHTLAVAKRKGQYHMLFRIGHLICQSK
jgi:hypothetical protein